MLLGPEFKGTILEVNEDRFIGKLTGCPMLNATETSGMARTRPGERLSQMHMLAPAHDFSSATIL